MIKNAFLLLLALWLTGCGDQSEKQLSLSGKQLPVTDSISGKTAVDDFIAPYKKSLDETMSEVLAYNKNYLVKTDGKYNTAIGNMMADIVLQQGNRVFKKRSGKTIDFVLLNHGGIRAAIPKGPVTRKTAFEIMPFENEIVVLELPGKGLQNMQNYLEKAKTAHPIAGGAITMNKDGTISSFLIDGREIDTTKTYFVATSDYLKNGGDNMTFFQQAVGETALDYKIRNAIIDYFTEVDTLDYTKDHRFIQE